MQNNNNNDNNTDDAKDILMNLKSPWRKATVRKVRGMKETKNTSKQNEKPARKKTIGRQRLRKDRFSQSYQTTNQKISVNNFNPLYEARKRVKRQETAKSDWNILQSLTKSFRENLDTYQLYKAQNGIVYNYSQANMVDLLDLTKLNKDKPVIKQSLLDKLLVLALLVARNDKYFDVVKNLVLDGADVNWASYYSEGARPVHIAARNGHVQTLKLLIEYNANISLTDNHGMTALHIASIHHQISTVRVLIDANININLEDDYGRSALHVAIQATHGIENSIYGTKEVQMFYLKHAFDMLDKEGDGEVSKTDLYDVLIAHNDTPQNIEHLVQHTAHVDTVSFENFINLLLPAQRYCLLHKSVRSLIDTQNELVRLLLNTYDISKRQNALLTRDHNGQVAFGLVPREQWYIENYRTMKALFENPLETGYDSEIFKDARTLLAVETEWNTVVRPTVVKRLIYQVVYALLLTWYVIWGLTWKNSRKITAFEVGLKQGFIKNEYDEHNTEAYFDMESIEEWSMWFYNVQMKELYPDPMMYESIEDGVYKRHWVNHTFRYHSKLIGDPRIRIVRQNILENDDETQPCKPDIYSNGGILNNPKYTTPCFKQKAHQDIVTSTNDVSKVTFPGELKDLLKYETCTSHFLSGAECDMFIGTVTDIPASGYVVYLPLSNKTEGYRRLNLLHKYSAINNLNTRAVAVEFIVYNHILGLFSTVSLVTEMSISGVVVPNALMRTYQILPYTYESPYVYMFFLAEFIIYCFFIRQIYGWYLEHKKFNMYRSSNIFSEIKRRYSKVVPKLFYPWFVVSSKLHRARSFSSMQVRSTSSSSRSSSISKDEFSSSSRSNFDRHDSCSDLSSAETRRKLSSIDAAAPQNAAANSVRTCTFGHSADHVCQHKSKNPATGVESYTFERHCTKELMRIPFTPFTLVMVESEYPLGWKLLRGYGNFFFDYKWYQVFISIVFAFAFVLHIVQIAFYHHMLITDNGDISIEELVKKNDFKKIQELFNIYGVVISRRLVTIGFISTMAWFEAVKHLSTLQPSLQVLMMTMQGMVGKLGSWFTVSMFLFFAYSLSQYVIFGSERGMKNLSIYLLESFTLAVGQSDLDKTADNIQDAIFEDTFNVGFILLFTIILVNLLIAIMTDAFSTVQQTASSRFCYSQFEQMQFHNMAIRGFKSELENNGSKYILKNLLHIKSIFHRHNIHGNSDNIEERQRFQKAKKNWGLVTLSTFTLSKAANKAKKSVEIKKKKKLSVELHDRKKGTYNTVQRGRQEKAINNKKKNNNNNNNNGMSNNKK